MMKQIGEFIGTGIAVIFAYTFYFIIMVISTVLLGLPVAVGIKIILDALDTFFVKTGVVPL